jgi:hypothetical protein
MRYASKYGYIVEQPSIDSNITPMIHNDAIFFPTVNLQAQVSNIFSSVPDNATMFQRSHTSTSTSIYAFNNASSNNIQTRGIPPSESTSFVVNNFNQTGNVNPGDELKMLERVIEIKSIQSWRDIHNLL